VDECKPLVLGTLLDYHVGNSCYVRNHVHTAVVAVIVGRGLHSFTFQLNLSPV